MDNRISDAVRQSELSLIRTMALTAGPMEDVISLGIGEPDFDTPKEVCQRALEDALRGATHYTPSLGDPELVEALNGYLKAHFGLDLSGDNVIVTAGGMGALTAFFRTVLDPGDEVLVPEPYFPPYVMQIELSGGRVVPVPTSFDDGFALRVDAVEKRMTRHTKAILLNYPHNPTGAGITGTTLDDLARLAMEHDILVVSDEVYDRFQYDGQSHESPFTRPQMMDRTVVVGSFSKSFAMTGWRLGYAYEPEWIIQEMNKVVACYTGCTSSVSQRAGLAALQLDDSIFEAMVEEFRLRRDFIYNRLSQMPGIRVHKPVGAFYVFPNLEDITDDTKQLALDLLEEERLVIVPGGTFGASGAHCVRMAFAVDRFRLAEALDRFSRFVNKRSHC
jgi:aspartate/methionine/tyrosine aminotransferase